MHTEALTFRSLSLEALNMLESSFPRSAAERQQLIESGLPLVKRIAHRLARRLPPNVQVDDLLSSGAEGLVRAVDAYDPSRSPRFETYAERRIRGSMLDELRGADSLTRHARTRVTEISRVIARLERTLERTPMEQEVSAAAGLSLDEYRRLTTAVARAPTAGILGDVDPDDVASTALDPATLLVEAELREHLRTAISELPARTLQVVALYYQHECTQAEIGRMLGVTESRVCQILGEATVRLRAKLAHAAVGPPDDGR